MKQTSTKVTCVKVLTKIMTNGKKALITGITGQDGAT